jgi:hypothetical protein
LEAIVGQVVPTKYLIQKRSGKRLFAYTARMNDVAWVDFTSWVVDVGLI